MEPEFDVRSRHQELLKELIQSRPSWVSLAETYARGDRPEAIRAEFPDEQATLLAMQQAYIAMVQRLQSEERGYRFFCRIRERRARLLADLERPSPLQQAIEEYARAKKPYNLLHDHLKKEPRFARISLDEIRVILDPASSSSPTNEEKEP